MSLRPFSNRIKYTGTIILFWSFLAYPAFCKGQTIEPFRPGIDDAKWVEIQVADSSIKVFGSLPTPDRHYIIISHAEQAGSMITIRAQAVEKPSSGKTIMMPAFRRFFHLIPAPPGVYTVMVYYTVLGQERLIKNQTVAILPAK